MSQELKNEADPKGGVWALLAVHFRQSLGAGEGKKQRRREIQGSGGEVVVG